MTDAGRRLDVAANNIANPDTTDLASDLVEGTMLAPIAYAANAQVIRAADETQRALLDIFA
jgi:flagellar basal body rod protein FlgC